VTLGVTSRLVNAVSGQQYLAATLGDTYYIRPPQVTLPGELPAGNQTSDLVAEIVLSAYKNWNVDLNLAYNPSSGQGERTFVQLQYKPGAERVIDVAYRYQRSVATPAPYVSGESAAAAAACSQNPLLTPSQLASCIEGERLNQAEIAGAWPVARNWTVFARAVYDFDANQALDRFAGFEYTSCCWRVRLLGRRYLVNGTGQQDTAVLFQFQLAGLAGVGPASDSFLGSAIRGYSPPSGARSTARSSLGTVSLFPP